MSSLVRSAVCLCAIALAAASLVVSAAPGEATNLVWCAGSKTCVQWDPAVPPGAYRVVRGTPAGFAALLNATSDSCTIATFSNTTTGPIVSDVPAAGGLYWYLVVATSCAGDGPAGNATAGARAVNSSGDCTPGTCSDGLRNGAESDVDCGGGTCAPCPAGEHCCVGADCSGLICTGEACAGASCADGIKNGNETDTDCGGGTCPACVPGQQCIVGTDCTSHVCTGGVCQTPTCTDTVKNGSETDIDCGGGACPQCPNGKNCNGNADCQSGNCQAGVCQAFANGTPCTTGSQCASGNCADGFCCNSACTGICKACSLAKTGAANGTCSNVSAGGSSDGDCASTPPASCGTTGTCNGSGFCSVYGPITQCAAAFCSNATTSTSAANCSGSGSCNTGTQTDCTPYACNSGTGLCRSNCSSDADCASGDYCSTSVCFPKKANGIACITGNQCSSGNCTDGVCCNTACNGLCQACSAAKKGSGLDGTCGNIAAGTDPDNECAGTSTCNGAGGCQ